VVRIYRRGNPKGLPLQGCRGRKSISAETPETVFCVVGTHLFWKPKSRAVAVNPRKRVDEEFEAPACPRCVSKNNYQIGETATGELLTSFVVGKFPEDSLPCSQDRATGPYLEGNN
jgi:hypothetical protein